MEAYPLVFDQKVSVTGRCHRTADSWALATQPETSAQRIVLCSSYWKHIRRIPSVSEIPVFMFVVSLFYVYLKILYFYILFIRWVDYARLIGIQKVRE